MSCQREGLRLPVTIRKLELVSDVTLRAKIDTKISKINTNAALDYSSFADDVPNSGRRDNYQIYPVCWF
jgi:hypothetical protein